MSWGSENMSSSSCDPVRDAVLGPAEQLGHGGDVVGHGLVREEPDLLDRVTDLAPQLVGLAVEHAAAVEQDVAEVMSTMRLTIRIAVVLPQPDGPTSTQISPAGTSNESDWIAGSSLPGYVLETLLELERGRHARERSITARPERGSDPRRGQRPRAWAASSSASAQRLQALEAQRRGDEPVGEPRVLGQQRPVQVGADHVAAAHALEAVVAVVAVARAGRGRAAARRRRGRCGRRGSRSRPARAGSPSSSTSMATLPISRGPSLAHGVQVDEPDAGQLLVAELVGVAEQLVAAADRRARPRRASAAACSASRLTAARSRAHSAWSRSWPPPM